MRSRTRDSSFSDAQGREVALDRRGFLGTVAAAVAATLAGRRALNAEPPSPRRRAVVWIELLGGNDGLNTVVPRSDSIYRRLRPTLALPETSLLPLDAGTALHPSLPGLRNLFEQGSMSVYRAIGPPKPDRSHFRSMAAWRTASLDPESCRDGWMGRALSAVEASDGLLPGITLGPEVMPAFLGARGAIPAIEDISDLAVRHPESLHAAVVRAALGRASTRSALATSGEALVREALGSALGAIDRIRAATADFRPRARFPDSPLGRRLRLAATLLHAGIGIRIVATSLAGFDTHSQQARVHALLLADLDGSVTAFIQELRDRGLLDGVLVVITSEFGRRVAENGSRGTDHGAGGVAFCIGGGLRPGLAGPAPDLRDLLDGDVRPGTDHRSLIAGVARDALGVDPAIAVPGGIEPLRLLAD